MALNLTTLTNPATSGDVLAEALTTADFLEGVPVLRNLARGSQKGGDAKQDVALNQPKALPLDANGKGYLYLSGVSGNYASVPNAANLNGITDFVMEVKDVYMADWTDSGLETFFAKYNTGQNGFVFSRSGGNISFYAKYNGAGSGPTFAHGLTGAAKASVKLIRTGTSLSAQIDTGSGYVTIGSTATVSANAIDTTTTPIEIGAYNGGTSDRLTGKIGQARIWNNATASGTPVLDVDFTATNVRHGATKFKCATGQVVTINQAGNDPSTIIKKPVLRFSSATSGLKGLFANQIDGGYMFAAFSVLGDGGEAWARVFTTSLAGSGTDYSVAGAGFSLRSSDGDNLQSLVDSTINMQYGMFDDSNGDILHVVKVENGSQTSAVNNAGFLSNNRTTTINSDEFNIGFDNYSNSSAAIDLEFLALFSADSVPDEATASKIRNYINKRNNVFSLVDNGFYFFDPQKADFTGNFTDANTLDGYITGSDNGDTDVRSNLTLVQATQNDQPSTDGYTITFNDTAEHLEFENSASQNLSGWQVVGTSLGTFAYRVDSNAITELNLLGNLGNVAPYRQTGDLYGIILLPESATGKDIEDARKLLIDRGAADGTTAGSIFKYWFNRYDIVEFKHINTSSVTSMSNAWFNCQSLEKFPALDLSNSNNFSSAWRGTTALSSFPAGAKLGTAAENVNFGSAWQQSGLTSFPALDLSNGNNFTSAWQGTTALQSFPAGAKLGTAASSGVNFTSAWQSSGLTSFPALDLSNGNIFTSAWKSCTSLTSFPAGAKLGTAASNVNMANAWQDASLTSFPLLDLSSATNFAYTWRGNDLTSFPKIDVSNGSVFINTWRFNQSLTDFPAGLFDTWNPSSINNTVFTDAWDGCTSLTAQSVENILVSIDASGQYATRDGNSGSIAITDAGIDIDYNTATGSLSAATNSAVTSLKSKGWSIIVNNVTL